MDKIDIESLKKRIYIPESDSHKGENGKLLVIGGSELFHAASLWAAEVGSRIVDMVYYSSVEENNEMFGKLKRIFRDGIVVKREDLDDYVGEADCVLMGPGMVRGEKKEEVRAGGLVEIGSIENEGRATRELTGYLVKKYKDKKWVLDAGSLQMMDVDWLMEMKKVLITPHEGEFCSLFGVEKKEIEKMKDRVKVVEKMAREYGCVVLLKGEVDVICDGKERIVVKGGNAGMTKGGTGDVLAGLVGGLSCKNDLFLAAEVGSYVNKMAGERLYKKVGFYYNASDLAGEVVKVLKEII